MLHLKDNNKIMMVERKDEADVQVNLKDPIKKKIKNGFHCLSRFSKKSIISCPSVKNMLSCKV